MWRARAPSYEYLGQRVPGLRRFNHFLLLFTTSYSTLPSSPFLKLVLSIAIHFLTMQFKTFNLLALLPLLPLTTAHFILNWPVGRGFDDDNAVKFPCGGFDTVTSNRTQFPLSGGPIQLDMHHTETRIAVYLALGNDPGSNYNIVLRKQLTEQGLGNFCLGQVDIPSSLNITAGMNATIQVVSNGDPNGGLYQVRRQRLSWMRYTADNSYCRSAPT